MIVALIEFDDAPGIRLVSNIVGCDPDEVYSSMPVEVIYQKANTKITMPVFRPCHDRPGQGLNRPEEAVQLHILARKVVDFLDDSATNILDCYFMAGFTTDKLDARFAGQILDARIDCAQLDASLALRRK